VLGVRRGIRMPKIMIDELLLMIIGAGMGLTVAYLRAEYVLHRRFKAAEQEKLSVQHELHANRLKSKQIDAPVAALRHQTFPNNRRFARRPDRHLPYIGENRPTW
jgi:CRISPR/Cas system CMR-associated protein Cmr5 small subunit